MRPGALLNIVGFTFLAVSCGQSDAGITTSVKTRLAADDTVKSRRIDVDTNRRVVTLKGDVGTAEEEQRALDIARNTDGVREVVDRLNVVPEAEAAPTTGISPTMPSDAPADDAGITAEVKSKLIADPDTSGLQIDVDTSGHVVTLTGAVENRAAKNEALRIAREVKGVSRVIDRLTVRQNQ